LQIQNTDFFIFFWFGTETQNSFHVLLIPTTFTIFDRSPQVSFTVFFFFSIGHALSDTLTYFVFGTFYQYYIVTVWNEPSIPFVTRVSPPYY